jgi:hypothetical protein
MGSGSLASQVELTLSWGSTVVRQASLCPPRAIYVGDKECPVPAARLGVLRRPLLLVREGKPCLAVWPGARGTITLPGEPAQPLDALAANGSAHPGPHRGDLHAVPLPAGSSVEIALGQASPKSVYRVPGAEDRLTVHVAVTAVPRRVLRRSAALRYASLAGLALSLLAHVVAFAAEPAPVLSPTAAQAPPDLHDQVYTMQLPAGALALPEPDGDWDRIHAPLDAGPNACGAFCEWRGFDEIGTREYPMYTAVRAPEPERERPLFLVPAELSNCFTRPRYDVGWPLLERVKVERAASLLLSVDGTRIFRPTSRGQVSGLLVVDEDEPVDWATPLAGLRMPRLRHPRLAFRSHAVEVVERSLARARSRRSRGATSARCRTTRAWPAASRCGSGDLAGAEVSRWRR